MKTHARERWCDQKEGWCERGKLKRKSKEAKMAGCRGSVNPCVIAARAAITCVVK